jgi:Na+/proline symporter
MSGLDVSYFEIILVLGAVTVIYTFIGGLRAVVWIDVVQMTLYVGGGLLATFFLLNEVPAGWLDDLIVAGKMQVFDFGLAQDFAGWLTQPYVFGAAVIGGAVFSMASHGTDQLIVQRLLACRSLRDSQKALVTSALGAMLQFALFLFVGLLLWSRYDGAAYQDLGLARNDEIFPMYIVEALPAGLSGLLLAGILAAAMSTLSSSLNSLSSSSMMDLLQRFGGTSWNDRQALRVSRILTFFWGLVLIGFASLFEDAQNPVVELGLAVASFTYGGLLGVFMLGLVNRRSRQADALIAFAVTIFCMTWIVFGLWYSPQEGWTVQMNPGPTYSAETGAVRVAWPWFPLLGTAITIVTGSMLALRHGKVP